MYIYKGKFVLEYIRDGKHINFPVNSIQDAVKLADAIADSDLLNEYIDYNMFELYNVVDGNIGETWSTKFNENDDENIDFHEYWMRYIRMVGTEDAH